MTAAEKLRKKYPDQQCGNCKHFIVSRCNKTKSPTGVNSWCNMWRPVVKEIKHV